MTKKRIMKELKITEISACDIPAQQHARVVIMKRADETTEKQNMEIQKIGGEHVASYHSFEEACEAIRHRENLSKSAAMSKAAAAYPDLVEAYNAEGHARVAKAAEAARPRPLAKAVSDFNAAVEDAMQRHKLIRSAAMQWVRSERPELFQAYQAA